MAQVIGWTGVGSVLFQFVLYPAICRTLGIVQLVRLSGVVAVLAILITPDIQHTSWSKRNSYVVGVTLTVLFQSCASVVRSTELFGPRRHNVPRRTSWAWGLGMICMSIAVSKLCNALHVLAHLFSRLVGFGLSWPTRANVLLDVGHACAMPRSILGRVRRGRFSF